MPAWIAEHSPPGLPSYRHRTSLLPPPPSRPRTHASPAPPHALAPANLPAPPAQLAHSAKHPAKAENRRIFPPNPPAGVEYLMDSGPAAPPPFVRRRCSLTIEYRLLRAAPTSTPSLIPRSLP